MTRVVPMIVGAALFGAIAPAQAQAQTETGEVKPVTLDGNVTLTSDYRFRGISQSNRDPAIQGTANITHRSGVYVGTFVSSIGRYVVDGADPEIDLYAGVKKTLGGTSIDGGLLFYYYPGSVSFNGNSFEPYLTVTHTLGPVAAKLGGNIAWKQRGLALVPGEKRAGLYTFGEVSIGIPRTPVTATAHVGHAFHATYGTFGERYTDWSLAATYTRKRISLTAAYVDTDKNIESYPGNGRNRNVSGAGVLASIAVAF